jgi:phosphatidylglycerophosphatase A
VSASDRPPPLSPHHPAVLIATGFGLGHLPLMPGTWASLAALPIGWGITVFSGHLALAAVVILAFATGCWAADLVTRHSGEKDPGTIVIDEIVAQWLVLVAVPLDKHSYAVAFVLFRLFDIYKFWPANVVDRSMPGGLGIMLDDIVSAVYALAILLIAGGLLGV